MIGENDDDARDNLGPGPTDDPVADAADYDVGYRKPPKSGQFKPGESGNPRGRKKREPTITDRLQKELGRKVPITEHGKKKSVSKLDLIFMTLTNQAAKGDLKAASMIISLLNSQAAETSPDLNTDVMNPEDLAILESFLAGMEVGEPFVDTAATIGSEAEEFPGADDRASPAKSTDASVGGELSGASDDAPPTEPGPPAKPAIAAETPPPPATTRQDYKPMVQPPQWRRPDDKQ
jgi:hypothetical protein